MVKVFPHPTISPSPQHNEHIIYRRGNTRDTDWTCAVKCEVDARVQVTQLKFRPGNGAEVTWPKLNGTVPLCSLLEHLGCSRHTFRASLSQAEAEMFAESFEAEGDLTPMPTFYVGHPEEVRVEALLEYLLPMQERSTKAQYLILMCKRLYKAYSKNEYSDRDSLECTRVENVGDLICSLTYQLLRRTASTLKQYLVKLLGVDEGDAAILKAFERCTVLTDGLAYAFATGIWDTTMSNTRRRVGVSQLLQRNNLRTMVSQLRRLSSAVPSSQKMAKPRYLHPSTFGRICLMETPEGASCGLETQLAQEAQVSLERDPGPPLEVIQPFVDPVCGVSGGTAVFLNGKFLGCTTLSTEMVSLFRRRRAEGRIHQECSIAHSGRTVHMRTGRGRILRPLLLNGVRQMIDFHEEKTHTVALFGEEGTLAEVNPCAILGFGAALVPFIDRMPTPRGVYQCAMQKQAVSVPCLSFNSPLFLPTTQNVLLTGQKPLVTTQTGEASGVYNLPAGFNAIVAVLPQSGFNQEDAICMSRGAVERGLGLCVQMRVQTVSMSCASGEMFLLRRPEGREDIVETVQESGLPLLNTEVRKGQCILGRVKRGKAEHDASLYAQGPGRVHRVIFTHGRGGDPQISVQIRQWMPIRVGDKLASRSAQKGVVSQIIPDEDLPFSASGIRPDFLISPAAFPSRMTASQLLEGGLAKLTLRSQRKGDGTPFQKVTAESIGEELKGAGFSPSGEETLFDGRTGRRLKCQIFQTPILYQRLKHFAQSKIHCRSTGRRNMVTRQPSGEFLFLCVPLESVYSPFQRVACTPAGFVSVRWSATV